MPNLCFSRFASFDMILIAPLEGVAGGGGDVWEGVDEGMSTIGCVDVVKPGGYTADRATASFSAASTADWRHVDSRLQNKREGRGRVKGGGK